ncbi:urease accessory protein UreF [Thiomicrorhabdus sp. ZW0627]|uniref:urease accessory protein UreF n=1 Tax=Thiomicrorhabdus sp. ZW0627 TaxID=3039774 RepID=UPI002436FFB0|nr:urease accessory protein UreF [Thiomicrorhabdus sp. ZW0627]MDG6773699.1 urease accessory protein UreF [Thiomicrorhabdus sp. ZW0627]
MQSSLLRLLQLSSPTLPVGAYAYSQGVEPAVHAGIVHDESTSLTWVQDVLLNNLVYGDLALLSHFYQAWSENDFDKLTSCSELSVALRESAELRQEDLHIAMALLRLAEPLEVDIFKGLSFEKTYPLVFAGFAQHWNIPLEETLQAFAWSWMENQVAAMIKLVPLGQTQGQKILLQMDSSIHLAVKSAQQIPLENIGNSLPHLAILSSQHETQYSRLFRS